MRSEVVTVMIRAGEVMPGDVINRKEGRLGWMEVADVNPLPDGNLLIADEGSRDNFTISPLDLIYLQTLVTLAGNSHLALPR